MCNCSSPVEETRKQFEACFGETVKAQRANRAQHRTYLEHLALLDGGTLTLASTVLFGNGIHRPIMYPFILKVGLASLVAAMIAFMIRNIGEHEREQAYIEKDLFEAFQSHSNVDNAVRKLSYRTSLANGLEYVGSICTVAGIIAVATCFCWSLA